MPLDKEKKAKPFDKLGILMVDDLIEVRSMLRAMLQDMGITQIFEAGDGKQAMYFMGHAGDMIDLVLCDWNMPAMTGIDLLKQIRSVDPEMPFLMVTGRNDMDSVVSARAAGVSGYILKPFSPKQIEAKLRIAIARKMAS